MENNDQVLDSTPTTEQEVVEQSTETETESTTPEEQTLEEKITPEQAYELARATQRGFTQTRQDIAEMKRTIEGISQKPQGEFAPTPQGQEPQTWGEMKQELRQELLSTLKQQEEMKFQEDNVIKTRVDNELSDLKFDGRIKTAEDQNELLDYALKHKETNLLKAYERLSEIKEAKKEGMKEGLKGNIKGEAGSIIGTSQKVSTEESKGIPYEEIHGKSLYDL